MSEHKEIKELFNRAAPEPRPELRERAVEAMIRTKHSILIRQLATTALSILIVLAALCYAPYSARGTRGMLAAAMAAQQPAAEVLNKEKISSDEFISADGKAHQARLQHLAQYRKRALEFVKRHYPHDWQMQVAAGVLTEDAKAALPMLRKAAETSGQPMAWAAYSRRLREAAPRYARLGNVGINLEDPEGVAQGKQMLRGWGLPDRLSPEATTPILLALKAWEKADPDNAIPVVQEVYYLYGLHRDAEALVRWQDAGQLPKVSNYSSEIIRTIARLFRHMDMSAEEAISAAYDTSSLLMSLHFLRDAARLARYEGSVANMEGRFQDAIAWWIAGISLGRHTQESADMLINFLIGVAVENIGAAPIWRWDPDNLSGISGGPLLRGRYFYGSDHEMFVRVVGEKADAQLRDQIVSGRARLELIHQPATRNLLEKPYLQALMLLGQGAFMSMLLVSMSIIFLTTGTWRRRQADESTRMGRKWRWLLVIFALFPASLNIIKDRLPLWLYYGAPSLSFFLALLLPLLAAFFTRNPGFRLVSAWRGNLRKVLPPQIVLCALISLILLTSGTILRTKWTNDWYSGKETEMSRIKKALGPDWDNPPIPADSWRAEYPPKSEKY